MRFFVTLLLVAFISATAHAQGEWKISDYLKQLPERFKTFSGDFAPPSEETTVIDDRNGYAAYMDSPRRSYAVFEIALFKSPTAPPLLVVSNTQADAQCTDYETFFLRQAGGEWVDVSAKVLPPLELKMFWQDKRSAARLEAIRKGQGDASVATFHFEPPRRGTTMKVSLAICDYLDDDTPQETVYEMSRLIETAGPVYLLWDAKKGAFVHARSKWN